MASFYILGQVQRGNLRYVKETHTDAFGDVVECEYLSTEGADYPAIMNARAVAIDAEKKSSEISRNISAIMENGSLATVVFKYSTKAENIGPLREAYRAANREVCIMIADYLAALTDAQLRSIFGKTQIEVTAMRTDKLAPAADVAAKIRAARGE